MHFLLTLQIFLDKSFTVYLPLWHQPTIKQLFKGQNKIELFIEQPCLLNISTHFLYQKPYFMCNLRPVFKNHL